MNYGVMIKIVKRYYKNFNNYSMLIITYVLVYNNKRLEKEIEVVEVILHQEILVSLHNE